jgi:hypothetical protein
MSVNLKTKTVCIVDNGLFVSFARTIAKGFGRTLYHKPFQSAFPRTNDLAPGRGFPELEWCEQPLLEADDIDLWVFLDLYQSGLQTYLREHGARVWGAGVGEDIELHRWEFKEKLKELGLPVQHCEHIRGMDDLRRYLKSHKGVCFVKTSFVRGDFETFKCENYNIVEPRLDELAHTLGIKKDTYEFIVEDEIPDAVEIGFDGFTINGEYPKTAMMAYEVKDAGMIGAVKTYDSLAEPVKLINTKMRPLFKDSSYQGFFCTEIRYTKSKQAYFIDPCCRLGTPSNELLQELFDDWPNVVWSGAEGLLVTPKTKARFGCLAIIKSEWATNDWLSLTYPRTLDDYVKLRFHVRKGSKDYIVPQVIGMPDVGVVVGTGDSLNAAIAQCKQRAKEVKGFQVEIKLDSLDEAVDIITQGEKLGIRF